MSSPETDLSYERTRGSNSYSSYKATGHRRFANSSSDVYRGDKSYISQRSSQSSRDIRSDLRPQIIASNFPVHASDDGIRDDLFFELKKFGDVTIDLRGRGDDRVAFVNFRNPVKSYDFNRYYQDRNGKLNVCDRNVQFDFDFDQDPPSDHSPQSQTSSPRRTYRQSKPKFDSLHMRGDRGDSRGIRGSNHGNFNSNIRHDNNNRKRDDVGRSRNRDFPQDGRDNFVTNPEDDPRATRTLFVGNLEPSIIAQDLKRIFDRYGCVQEIDVKRPNHPQGGTYAFVKFSDLDTAARAKAAMANQYIGRNMCKVGYGKSVPSTRLWVGGLGPWTSMEELNREFDRFGTISRIDYDKGSDYAYVLFDSQDAASVAAREMKGYVMAGSSQKLKIDFASADEKRIQRDSSSYNSICYNKDHYSANMTSDDRRHGTRNSSYQGTDSYRQFDKRQHVRQRQGGNWSGSPRTGYFERESSHDSQDRLHGKKRNKRPQSPGAYSHNSSDGPRGRRNARESQNDCEVSSKRRRSDNSTSVPLDDRTRPSEAKDKHKPSLSGELSELDDDAKTNGKNVKADDKDVDGKQETSRTESLLDVAKRFAVAWRGTLALRNSIFPVRMHLIGGNPELADHFLRSGASSGTSIKALNITQRLRLDQPKLEEVSRRINTAGASGHCILLALPAAQQSDDVDTKGECQPRPLRSLVTYFKQKQAAGVIPMPVSATDGTVASGGAGKEEPGVLHAFPPCEYSHQQLLKVAPNLGSEPSKEDHLVVVLVRGAQL